MKKRSEGKGGRRQSARKAQSQARSNGEPSSPSVPPFVEIFQELAIERQKLLEALRYTLREYDRAVGTHPDQSGWTAADIVRLEKIREMVKQ